MAVKKKKNTLSVHSLVLKRLEYFKKTYQNKTFRRIVENLESCNSWTEVQKDLVKIRDNNLRGAVYEEIARAIISSVTEFTDLYKEVYFNRFPTVVKDKLILENGDFGIDAVGLTHDGDYHAFQMKHKIHENDEVYWSADRMANFIAEGEKAARLIVMSNTMGACRHFRLKAGPRYKNFGKNSLRELDNNTLTKMGKVLKERIERYDKLASYKAQNELYSALITVGFSLFKKLRKKFPEWEIELESPEQKPLYKIRGKDVYVPVYDEEDGITIIIRFYFHAKKQISDEEFFEILNHYNFEENRPNTYEMDLQSPYNFTFMKFHALGQFALTICETFPLEGQMSDIDEHVRLLVNEAERLEDGLLEFLKVLNKKMSFNVSRKK